MTAVADPKRRMASLPSLLLIFAATLLPACGADMKVPAAAPEQPAGANASATAAPAPQPEPSADATPDASPLHGRLEQHGSLRIVRVWGTPQQRGFAQGMLLGNDIADVVRKEFQARFARKEGMLQLARNSLSRLVQFPPDVAQEIEALFLGVEASGADRDMPELGRKFDLQDLQVANALDVFGLMGCSGFTLWGDEVEGGGVLTGRNFDWPFTGPHMIDNVVLLVEHDEHGFATASVAWPGYVATVTGINQDGVAAFLHVGTGEITWSPEPESWPTAVAAREILEQVHGAASDFEKCKELLAYTSPPAGYIPRVVFPRVPAGDVPIGIFETDRDSVVRAAVKGPVVTTNHFIGRSDGRTKSKDSANREKSLQRDIATCLEAGDHKVSPQEGWDMLQAVDRGGKRGFGTLHSLVFRAEPWFFELRIAEAKDKELIPATRGSRRFVLTRDEVFAKVPR